MDTLNIPRTVILVILIAAVIGGIFYLNSQKVARSRTEVITIKPRTLPESESSATPATQQSKFLSTAEKPKRYELAKEITTPDGFINTPSMAGGPATPITISEFVGKKVILVDFWTYSCINCQRTTPYLNAWYEKYGSLALATNSPGLVIIGIHTPEFEFEKNYQNVLDATKRLGIKYPVVLDNDYSTWTAYQNRFWPHKYLIDIDGFIVYDHIGEGDYDATEKKIQELLTERAAKLGESGKISADIVKPQAESVDETKSRSPEIYFGAARNEHLGNGTPGAIGNQTFVKPTIVLLNTLYLVGDWRIDQEFAEAKTTGASVIFKYAAAKVFIVAASRTPVAVEIYRDGLKIKTETVQADQLYRIVDDNIGYGEHTLELRIPAPGLKLFTFTFG